MRVACVNIRSLIPSLDELSGIANEMDFDILGVTETWLDRDFPSSLINLENFNLVRKDRSTRGGGVCWFIRDSVKFCVLDTNYVPDDNLEQLWIAIKFGVFSYAFGVIYRPPSAPIGCLTELEAVLSSVSVECDFVVMVGDLNIDFIKEHDPATRRMNTLLQSYNLVQVLNQPTRITDETETLIDPLCVDKNLHVMAHYTVDLLALTDHRLIYGDLGIAVELPKPRSITYRDYSCFDPQSFSLDAAAIDWERIRIAPDVDQKVYTFNSTVLALFERHAPLVTIVPKRNYRPYITSTLREMMKLKNKAYGKYRRTRSEVDHAYYKDLRNYVTLAIRNEKNAYFKFNVSKLKNDGKRLWKFFSDNSVHCKPCGTVDEDIAEPDIINAYFVNSVPDMQGSNELVDFFCNERYSQEPDIFEFGMVTAEDVEKTVCSLRSDAYGSDHINLKMLRAMLPFCLEIITDIVNTSLISGTVPLAWKHAIVTPLSKVPRATDLVHLRPISILPAMSKLLEKIVSQQLQNYLHGNNILPPLQSGFRKHYSTATALSRITGDIAKAIDASKVTFLVLLDYSKAFEVVDHDLLVSKLMYYGCSGSALQWFINYLDSRVQQVKFSGVLSSELTVSRGVPQGSILGPLLFSIFTADLPNVILKSRYHLYADDTQIYVSCRPCDVDAAIADLNLDLSHIYRWSCDNGLILNSAKTVAMCLGTSSACACAADEMTQQVVMSGHVIPLSVQSRNLGLILDQHLSFEPHINKKISVCCFKLKTLYKFRYILPPDIKWSLCNALVLSQLDYCAVVYYNFLTRESKGRLQILQNNCFRYSYFVNRFEHITPHYVHKGILKLHYRYMLLFATFLYSVIKSGLPEYLVKALVYRTDIHSLNLRYTSYLTIPKHNTSKYEGCFEYNASKIFNEYIHLFEGTLLRDSFRFRVCQILLNLQRSELE